MKDFIPYEEALALRQLEFDEPCLSYYDKEKKLCRSLLEYPIINSKNGFHHSHNIITAPLFSQAFRFFREKYNMLANVYSNASGFLFEWHDTIGGTHRHDSGFDGPNDSGCWDTYEDAELACLRELIKIAKTKKP